MQTTATSTRATAAPSADGVPDDWVVFPSWDAPSGGAS